MPKRRKKPALTPEQQAAQDARRKQRNRSLWSFVFAIFGWYLLRPTNEWLAVGVALAVGIGAYVYLGWREGQEERREAKRRARLERWAREDEEERESGRRG